MILMLMLWSTEQNLLIYTVSIIDIFFFLNSDKCRYEMVDLYCENGFLRTILQTRWSLRCKRRGEVHFEQNISTRICQFSFFLWWHSFGPNLWRLYFNVLVHLYLFVIMVLTSMTVISWWWKHYYYYSSPSLIRPPQQHQKSGLIRGVAFLEGEGQCKYLTVFNDIPDIMK